MNRIVKTLRVLLPLLVAAGLIAGLFVLAGISLSEFVTTLRKVSTGAIAGILASTGLFLFLSALKWRLVMAHIAADSAAIPKWDFSIYFTCLGSVLALIIMPHAAMVVSRSLGSKLHRQGSAVAAAAASAYEQLFDVIPIVAMVVAAIVTIAFDANLFTLLALAIVLNGLGAGALSWLLQMRFWSVVKYIPLPSDRRKLLREKLEWFGTPDGKSLLGVRFVAIMFGISLVRYAILLLRTALVIVAIGLPISGFQFTMAFALARISTLISITPGELGINEWTWTGILTWMEIPVEEAARFVLANRVYNDASLLAFFGIVWLAFAGRRLLRAGTIQDQAIK